MGGINSPLGSKQNCASPSSADTHNVPKSFERVGVDLSFCVVLICTGITQQDSLFWPLQGGKERSPSVQGDNITSLPISIPLSTVHPSKLPVSIPLASVVLPSRAEKLVSSRIISSCFNIKQHMLDKRQQTCWEYFIHLN